MEWFEVFKKGNNIVTAPHCAYLNENDEIIYAPVDLGTDIVAKAIFEELNFSMILPKFSRFLIDFNRRKENCMNISMGGHCSFDTNYEEKKKRFDIYDDYYETLKSLIDQNSLHIAIHSMFPYGPKGAEDEGVLRPDFRLGTLHDKTMDKNVVMLLATELEKKGYRVEVNNVFLGREEIRFTNSFGSQSIQFEINSNLLSDIKNNVPVREKSLKTAKDIINVVKKVFDIE